VIYVWNSHGDDLPRVPENLATPLMLLDLNILSKIDYPDWDLS